MTKWKGEAASYAPHTARRMVMVARPRFLTLSILVLASGLAAGPAAAADYYWDADGSGLGLGGTGTWNTSAPPLWNSTGNATAGPFFTWDNAAGDNSVFAGTAGTVTLGAPITVHNITFDTSGYTLSGNTLTLTGTAPTITVNAGTSGITSIITGTTGLTKAGAGGLTLSGANTFSGGVTVSAGTLTLNSASTFTGNINVASGAFLGAASDAALGAASNTITLNGGTLTAAGALNASRQVIINSSAGIAGAGVGSALITGDGTLSVASGVTLNNDANTYTGTTTLNGSGTSGSTVWFTSVRNAGFASSLGASGDIVLQGVNSFNDNFVYTGDGDTTDRTFRFRPGSNASVALGNSGTGTLALTGSISLEGFSRGIIIGANSADINLSGVISGTTTTSELDLTGGAGRTITLGGANTYSTSTEITTITVVASTLADIGSNSSFGTGSTNSDIKLTNGTLRYTGSAAASNRTWSVSGVGTISNDGSGALALSGAATLNPGGTLTFDGSYTGVNTFSGVISGTGNLASNGAGTWELTGANTRTGAITVNSGTLRASNAQAFGTVTDVTVNGGTLDFNGNNVAPTSLNGTGGTVALGSGNLTLNLGTGVTNSYGGSIAGTGGSLTKLGAGTLTLTGQSSYTGATTIGGGTLALDFSQSGGPTSSIISASSPLIMNGGIVKVAGAAGETNVQSFGGLTVTTGNNTVSATSGTGGSTTINLGNITRTGGLANFVLPTAGAITTVGPDRVLGGWATVNGSDYAKVAGNNIIAFTANDYVQQDNASLWQTNQILSDAGGAPNTPFYNTVGATIQIGGLQYTAAANSTVTVANGQTLGVDGTIIVAPSVGATNQTITGGSITGTLGGGVLGVQQNGTGTFTIASTIADNTGTVGFSKAGTGKVVLSGSNTYTGATIVSQGTLSINSVANAGTASAIGAASTDPANLVIQGATLEYTGASASTDRGLTLARSGAVTSGTISVTNTATNLTISGQVVSPDGANFIKAGPGTLTISNTGNTYTGVTTVSQGTLAVTTLANGGSPSSIGASSSASSNLVLQGGGKLSYIGGTASSNRGFTLGTGGGGIDVIGGTTLTMSGVAAGSGSLAKTGAGTLVLSGANTYTGGTTVSAGILRAGSTNAFGPGAITVNSPATLDIADIANVRTGGLGGDGTVNLGVLSTTRYIIDGNNSVFSGIISGAGGVTLGSGSLTFSGCKNTYGGPTTIWGTLAVSCLANGGSPSDIGASGTAPSNLVLAGGTLNYVGDTVTTNRGFTTGGWISVSKAATTLTFMGQATGGGALVKLGPGTLVLSGTNDYTGGTTVSGGILRAGSTSAFGTGGMTVNTATLDLANLSNTVAGLAGAGNVTLGSATLTLSDGANLTFSGTITGTGGVVKNGTRTQVLSGTASSYTGSTLINGGVLAVASLANGSSNSSIGASTSAPINLILNGGTLQYNGTGGSTDRQFTLGSSGGGLDASGAGAINFTSTAPVTLPDTANRTLTLSGISTADNTLSARIDDPASGTTSLTKTGTGTWVLANAASTYTGVTTISGGGVLAVDKLADGDQASSIGKSAKDATNLVIGSGSTLRYTGAGDTTDRLFTLQTGITLIESSGTGAIVFNNTGSASYTGNAPRTLALGGTNTGLNTMGGTIIDGPGGATTLAKNDSGTWVLTGNNSYTGNTVVNDGNLMIGNGGTTGNAGTGNVIVNSASSTLSFNRSDTFNFSGTLSGPGSLAQIGTGTTVLTAATNSIGSARVDAGTLQVGNGATAGGLMTATFAMNAGTLTVAANGTVSASGANPTAIIGNAGAATINVDAGGVLRANGDLGGGSDTVTVSGTLDTGTGRLNLGAGNDTLVLNDSAVFSGAGVDAGTGGESGPGDTLQVATIAGRTLDGATVTQFETLLKQGTGTLTLVGDHSYSAGSTIAAGTLQIGNGGTSGTLAGPITNNGTLALNRADALTVAGPISGSGGVNQIGAGVTTLTGANSYAGPTHVQAGTLLVNGNQAAATGLTTVANGATLGGTGILGGAVTVADGATLNPGALGPVAGTLTINGNLTLGSGSTLAYNFGQAGVEGGPLNDLIKIGGNVRLDGTLNITQTSGGSFGPGVYRIMSYGGSLDNQGLTVASPNYLVQTAVAQQVNLVNTAGLTLNFWDGNAGPKNDQAVNGGDGTWRAGGDDNWTDRDGQVNAGYASNTFAIFQGAAGTVTVEAGGVGASGLQFATGGYAVQGGPITLVPDGATGQSIIRVGDGTADGAAYVATVASALAGNTQLVKTDLGTLVLAGTNSYTGGTFLDAGTLQVDRDANLGTAAGALTFDGGTLRNTASFASARGITLNAGGGTFETAADLTLTGAIAGAGALTKTGTGTLVLAGANTYQGGTFIDAGTLSVASDANLGNAMGGLTFDGGTLRNTGTFSSARSVTLNAGGGTFETNADLTLTGVIAGAGALTKTGAGTLVLAADNSYGGGTTIAAGTLQLGTGGASGSMIGNVTNAGVLAFNRSDGYTFAGLISGSGRVDQIGPGTTIITANNTYTGQTNVHAGTLIINSDQSAATGLTSVSAGGALGGVGTIGGDVTVADVGALNPGGITNAPGTLTINGDLTLSAASDLNYNFGQANVVGGAFNDLTAVGGNLILDGVLNVTKSAGGSFRPGIYRIISYAGGLDDRGVTLGAMPAGTYTVQTAIAQQVNLVNTTGVTLNFWDGPGGAPGDTQIHGGDGAWRLTDNSYWTDDTGFLNGAYGNGAFAVFAGQAGTVSVDNANGQVEASGLQFATDGYVINGGPLALVGGAAIVRVGDGTLAGKGMTATVEAALTGNAALVKADLGTLVLTGMNSYTGGTVIEEGTLQVSSDRNLGAAAGALTLDGGTLHTTASFASTRPVTLASTGTVRTDDGTVLTLSGAFAGSGGFTKTGDGALVMAGASTYSGTTTVAAGTLRAGAANALSDASAHAILGGATLDLAGFSQTVGTLANAGTVRLGSTPGATLTVAGDYTGSDGTIAFTTALGDDHSATNRLVVNGNTSGTTTVRVTNLGGTGAPTVNGIKLIDVRGASLGTFTLRGDYLLQGQPAVVAGAYGYTLQKNGVSTPTDGDWYLRSSLVNPTNPNPADPDPTDPNPTDPNPTDPDTPTPPPGPLYQPGVPLYESYAQVLLAMNGLPTLQQRVGTRYWGDGVVANAGAAQADAGGGSVFWGRIEGLHRRSEPSRSLTGATQDTDQLKLQAGLDGLFLDNAAGRLIGGLTLHYGTASADIRSLHGSGEISTQGFGFGGTLTWYGQSGLYVDGQVQASWFASDLSSHTAGRAMAQGNNGFGYALGAEVGQRIGLGGPWSLTPQAQLVYSSVHFDSFTDPFGARVSLDDGDSLQGRLGLAVDYQNVWQDAAGRIGRAKVYGIANLHYEFLNGTDVDVASVSFARANDRLWGGIGAGGSYSWGDDKYALYGEVSVNTSLANFGDSYDYRGSAGFRMQW